MQLDHIRHSLAHLLAAAVLKKFPDAKLGIGPTIEYGFYYDFLLPEALTPDMLKGFEKEMRSLISKNLPFKGEKVTASEAKERLSHQPFKLELIDEFSLEGKDLTVYHTGEVFSDLCKGGHVEHTSEIPADAFKLTHIAGAYWRGDEKREQLQRVYGLAFETKEQLEAHLTMLEETKKRDHRVLGEQLKIFTVAPEVGPGLPLWLPNGTAIREALEERAKHIEKQWGYKRVATPHIAKEELYRMSGHIPYYADDMFPPMQLDDGNYYLKAMNCPHTHMIYRAQPHSYRELPIRYAEYGTVYRHELSGTLSGLLRVRGFTQNDAHIYCREDQAEEEFLNVMKLHEYWYKEVFGIKDFYMRLSLPAADKKKYVDMPEGWQKSVEIVRNAMKKSGLRYEEVEGEAAFYGPKVDFQIKSVIGTEYTASTNQLDFLATQRFNLTYKDSESKDKPVYVIHRAPLGSHERFVGFLIEHYAGAFPFWLAPVQAKILTISEEAVEYAQKVFQQLDDYGIRVELDDRNESIGKKIRESELQKIPYLLIIGKKEAQEGNIALRKRGEGDKGLVGVEEFLKQMANE